jgi:tryptophanyl-tRNA synthetase
LTESRLLVMSGSRGGKVTCLQGKTNISRLVIQSLTDHRERLEHCGKESRRKYHP